MDRRKLLQLAAASLVLGSRHSMSNERQSVSFLNWDSYIGPSTLRDFEAETGVAVNYGLFADNFELFAKVRTMPGQYDLITPSNMLVEIMIQADLLAPIDKTKLGNWDNIDPAFRNPVFDPDRKFSVPYTHGALAIGYRRSAISKPPVSWADVFSADRYSGKLAIPNDSIIVMQLALKALGVGVNGWCEKSLAEAERMLTLLKPNLLAFSTSNGQDLLLAGEADIVVEQDGPLKQAMLEDDDLDIIYPEEGTLIWEDVLCILGDSQNTDNTHLLIDYLLDADVAAAVAENIDYTMSNTGAMAKKAGNSDKPVDASGLKRITTHDEYGRYPGQEVFADVEKRWLRIKLS